jgi:peptidoglycan/LPS O-acetylase OafA/YrhL
MNQTRWRNPSTGAIVTALSDRHPADAKGLRSPPFASISRMGLAVTWSHQPALDGVRTLAVYLVLLYHAGIPAVAGGYIGVDLFFVLSGFLVSNVILSEIDERGRFRLGRFYARRVRRLLPAAVVVVVATGAAFVLVTSIVRRLPFVGDARSALLYFANWHFLSESNDYFATGVDRSPYLHFWSLSIEEQFYIFFPVLLVVFVVLSRRWRWALPVGLGVLMTASVGCQLYWLSADPAHAYYGTDSRLYQLLAGAMLAALLRLLGSARRVSAAGIVGLLVMLLFASGLLDVGATWRGFVATAAGVMLLLGLMSNDTGPVARLFAHPLPAYLGRISYGTYLWHWPVLLVIGDVLTVPPLVIATLGVAVSTGLAALSFQLLEMPIRRREWPFRMQWPAVLTGLAVSGLVALLVMPPILESTRRPVAVASSADLGTAASTTGSATLGPATTGSATTPAGSATTTGSATTKAGSAATKTRVPRNIDWNAVANDRGAEHSCTVPSDCYLVKGHGPTVVLVGDSHAQMLEPMFRRLATEHGFSLAANMQDGCPWQADVVNYFRSPKQREQCILDRAGWYDDVLPRLHPDLVIAVSQSYDSVRKFDHTNLERVGGSDESVGELLRHTTHETLGRFRALGTRVLVVHNTIRAGGSPLDCLAGATFIEDCLVLEPTTHYPSDGFYDDEDAARDEMFTVDINPAICPDAPRCRPMLGGRVVWRDSGHLAAGITVYLRDKIWDRISETGALDGLGIKDSS